MVNRYFVYKQALRQEAEQLVQARVIHEKEDIYYSVPSWGANGPITTITSGFEYACLEQSSVVHDL